MADDGLELIATPSLRPTALQGKYEVIREHNRRLIKGITRHLQD